MRKLSKLYFCIILFLVACGEEGASEPIEYPEESSAEICSSSENAPVSSIADIQRSSSSEDLAASSSSDDTNSSSSVESGSSSSSSSARNSSSSMVQYVSYGTMTDERDGQIYKTVTIEGEFHDCRTSNMSSTVKISKTTWMAENLKYAYLQPTKTLDSSSRCFGNNVVNCEKYGRMYLWSAAMDSAALFTDNAKGCGYFATIKEWLRCPFVEKVRGVCPKGWRIPTRADLRAIMPWRVLNGDEFNENQLQQADWRFMTSSHFWVAEEEDTAYAYRDDYDPDTWKCTEENTVSSSVKEQYHSIRCVRDYTDSISLTSSSSFIEANPCKIGGEDNCVYGSLFDERDGQTYKTVQVGRQTWMAENLNYAYLQPTDLYDSSSWCYKNEPDSCAKYGRLYFWSSAVDSVGILADENEKCSCSRIESCEENESVSGLIQGVCPNGWHLPTRDEFLELQNSVRKSGWKLKSIEGWVDNDNGTDEFGFGVMPTGMYETPNWFHDRDTASAYFKGLFSEFGHYAFLLGAENDCVNASVFQLTDDILIWVLIKTMAFPVRCIKD